MKAIRSGMSNQEEETNTGGITRIFKIKFLITSRELSIKLKQQCPTIAEALIYEMLYGTILKTTSQVQHYEYP